MPEPQNITIGAPPEEDRFDSWSWMKQQQDAGAATNSPEAMFQKLAETAKTDPKAAKLYQMLKPGDNSDAALGERFNFFQSLHNKVYEDERTRKKQTYGENFERKLSPDLGHDIAERLLSVGLGQTGLGSAGLEGKGVYAAAKAAGSGTAKALLKAGASRIMLPYRIGAAAVDSGLAQGPLDYVTGKEAAPNEIVSGGNVGNAVSTAFNLLQAKAPLSAGKAGIFGDIARGMQTAAGRGIAPLAEGALSGGLGAAVEGQGAGMGTGLGIASGIPAALAGALSARLSKTGKVLLEKAEDGSFKTPTLGPGGEKIRPIEGAGLKESIKLEESARKDAADALQSQNEQLSPFVVDALEKEGIAFPTLSRGKYKTWYATVKKEIEAGRVKEPTVLQAVAIYEKNQTEIAAQAKPSVLKKALAEKAPEELYHEIRTDLDNLLPAEGIGSRQSDSLKSAQALFNRWDVLKNDPRGKKAMRQAIINKFADYEINTTPAAQLAGKMKSLPSEAAGIVNKVFDDPQAFEKLVGLAEAHKKFADLETPWVALTTGRRSNSQTSSRSFGTVIGDVGHLMTFENMAEAIMQKKGFFPKLLAQWGENIVTGKSTPGHFTRELAREAQVFMQTAQGADRHRIRKPGTRVLVKGKEHELGMPSEQPSPLQQVADANKARGVTAKPGASRGSSPAVVQDFATRVRSGSRGASPQR